MHKEGKNWQNMLGLILGISLMAGIILPEIVTQWIYATGYIDVYNEAGFYTFLLRWIDNTVAFVMSYIECILVATVISGFRTARHIPRFDKDAIMILGCMIQKDGSLTPLLKSRTDRAIEFAKMQKDASGKDIYFVPSGGKGNNEIMAEGEAVARYLTAQGIPEERIIIENQSVNTDENFKLSYPLIQERTGLENPAVAFSTTNYHVFRSGLIARKHHVAAEGIGANTKSYFWINAFIREFVATLVTERKLHIRVLLMLQAILLILLAIAYLCVVL